MSPPAAGLPPTPPSVRLSTLLFFVVGALLLVTAVGVGLLSGRIAGEVFGAATETADRVELTGALRLVAGVFALFAVLTTVVAFGLRRRQVWARICGIGVGILMGVLGVQTLLGSGGGGLIALLLPLGGLAVGVTVIAGLLNRDASAWFAGSGVR